MRRLQIEPNEKKKSFQRCQDKVELIFGFIAVLIAMRELCHQIEMDDWLIPLKVRLHFMTAHVLNELIRFIGN